MKRLAVLSLWLLAPFACALPVVGPPFPPEEIDPDYTPRGAWVQAGQLGPYFITVPASDSGAKEFGSPRLYPVSNLNLGFRLARAGDRIDAGGLAFPGEPASFAQARLAGASQFNQVWSTAANVSLSNGKFDATLYAGYIPDSATVPFTPAASLSLSDPGTSTELLDWYLTDLLLGEDDPTTRNLENLAYYLAWVAQESATPNCSRLSVRVISLRAGIDEISLKYAGTPLTIDPNVCGVRFAASRGNPLQPGAPIVTVNRVRENNVEAALIHRLARGAATNAVASATPEFALDTSFGSNGQVTLRAPTAGVPLRYFDHAVDTQGRVLVVYGIGRSDGSYVPTLARLTKDGTLDPTFANGGTVVIPTTGQSANPRTVTVDINGHIQVTGETYTATTVRPFAYFLVRTSAPGTADAYSPRFAEYSFQGFENSAFFRHVREPDGRLTAVGVNYGNYPDTSTMRPLVVRLMGTPAAARAIEFFHAVFGHYVTVVNPVEVGKLDSGETAGWARTKKFFYVYPLGTPGTIDVDRYFSQGFPKSSHVFAANAAESAAIRKNPDWLFEGPVFGAIPPDASGMCPGPLHAVTRIYNNGKTGAPNHQFADDPATTAQAEARGGTREGFGPKGAIYCVE